MEKVFFTENGEKAAVHKRLLSRFKDTQKKKYNDLRKSESTFKHLCSKKDLAIKQEMLFNSKQSKSQINEVSDDQQNSAMRRMEEKTSLKESLAKADAHLENILDLKDNVKRQDSMIKKVQSKYDNILKEVPILNEVMKKINTIHFRQKCALYTFIFVFTQIFIYFHL